MAEKRAKKSYRAVLRLPGFRLLLAASLLSRIGIGMIPLTLIFLAQRYSGSLEWGGYATAGFIAANVLTAPGRARFIDVAGYRSSLTVLAVSFVAATEIIAIVVLQRPHPAWIVLTGALAGCATAPVGGVTRVLFARIAPDPALRQRAYGIDAVSEEVSLTLGPLLAGLTASMWSPLVSLQLVSGLCLLGVSTLALAPASRTRPAEDDETDADQRERRVLGYPGVLAVLGVLTGSGLALGFIYVGVPITMDTFGDASRAGLALAVFSAASGVGGLLYGSRAWRLPAGSRLLIACLLFAAGTMTLGFAGDTPALCVALAAAGLCVAPILISGYLLVDALTPIRVHTTATTWANTVSNGGIAAGSALISFLLERTSPVACFGSAALLLIVAALVSTRWLPTLNKADTT